MQFVTCVSTFNFFRLFQVTALWLASGQIPATTLSVLINEHQVKDGTALDFFLETMVTLKTEKGGQMVVNVIKKSGMLARFLAYLLYFVQYHPNPGYRLEITATPCKSKERG